MTQIATITSKMQLTVPAKIATNMKLREGQKVFVEEKNGKMEVTPIESLVEELAGSLEMPKYWQGKSVERIIQEAKVEYFLNKRSK